MAPPPSMPPIARNLGCRDTRTRWTTRTGAGRSRATGIPCSGVSYVTRLTVELSDARADVGTWHLNYHASAPASVRRRPLRLVPFAKCRQQLSFLDGFRQ